MPVVTSTADPQFLGSDEVDETPTPARRRSRATASDVPALESTDSVNHDSTDSGSAEPKKD